MDKVETVIERFAAMGMKGVRRSRFWVMSYYEKKEPRCVAHVRIVHRDSTYMPVGKRIGPCSLKELLLTLPLFPLETCLLPSLYIEVCPPNAVQFGNIYGKWSLLDIRDIGAVGYELQARVGNFGPNPTPEMVAIFRKDSSGVYKARQIRRMPVATTFQGWDLYQCSPGAVPVLFRRGPDVKPEEREVMKRAD